MNRFRFSIASVLMAVVYIAILFAALKSGSNDWFKLVYTATFVMLLYGGIAARYRGPFWYGFAVVGWAFFLVGFGGWVDNPYPGRSGRVINRNLISAIIPEIISGSLNQPADSTKASSTMRQNEWANRDGVCHSGLTLIFGILGGLTARRVASNAILAVELKGGIRPGGQCS